MAYKNRATRDHRHPEDPTHIYLNDQAQKPLFTPDEELKAFIAFDKARDKYRAVKREYEVEKKRISNLNGESTGQDHKEIKRLARNAERLKRRYWDKRNDIIERNTRLVVSVAVKYTGQGVAFADLIQAGNFALFRAVEKFNFNLGYKFSTYATPWIRQGITRTIADTRDTIRKPVHICDKINATYKQGYILYRDNSEWPTVEQLADTMEIEVEKVKHYLEIGQPPISLENSLNEPDDDKKEFTGHDILAIEEDSSPGVAEANQLSEILEEVLFTLTPREQKIVKLRFGLVDGEARTLEEVGQMFGVTRERIRQIEKEALRKLRHPRRSRKLKEFLEA